MADIKERYRRFKEWEQQPHEVAPLSENEHECATCGTHFEGNYCPRCGQSAKIGRYSFKKALLLFLDVWGVGNRGMFRSLRDLILRPGYMIRDYLRGMQMAYFPPFKMFFLLFTLTILIQSGLNIKGLNYYEQQKQEEEVMVRDALNRMKDVDGSSEAQKTKAETKAKTAKQKRTDELFDRQSRIILYAHLAVALLLAALALVPPLSGHTGYAPFRVHRRDGLYQQYAHHL